LSPAPWPSIGAGFVRNAVWDHLHGPPLAPLTGTSSHKNLTLIHELLRIPLVYSPIARTVPPNGPLPR